MEEKQRKPFLPPNYVTLKQLQEQRLKEQQQKQKEEEEKFQRSREADERSQQFLRNQRNPRRNSLENEQKPGEIAEKRSNLELQNGVDFKKVPEQEIKVRLDGERAVKGDTGSGNPDQEQKVIESKKKRPKRKRYTKSKVKSVESKESVPENGEEVQVQISSPENRLEVLVQRPLPENGEEVHVQKRLPEKIRRKNRIGGTFRSKTSNGQDIQVQKSSPGNRQEVQVQKPLPEGGQEVHVQKPLPEKIGRKNKISGTIRSKTRNVPPADSGNSGVPETEVPLVIKTKPPSNRSSNSDGIGDRAKLSADFAEKFSCLRVESLEKNKVREAKEFTAKKNGNFRRFRDDYRGLGFRGKSEMVWVRKPSPESS